MMRKGKLWKQCKRCGKMYPAYTKGKGLCPKCKPESNFDKFLKLQGKLKKQKTK